MSKQLEKITEKQCALPPKKYDDLKVLFLNCTLNRIPILSHTEGLIKVAEKIFQANNVSTIIIRPLDYDIPACGNFPDEWEAGRKSGFDSPEHKR